jgi:dTDP-4-amino-4,6-dideoxygalactose transaminase
MKPINVFRPFFRRKEVLKKIDECLSSGWTGIGGNTKIFEDEWIKYSGFKNCHFLNSASAGLHLAVKIFKNEFNWKKNDEIITTGLTFVSTNHAILYEGLKPVFCDVDSSLCLSLNSIKKMITKKTKAIMYVALGGNTKNFQQISNFCKKKKLVLILDAAHMAGSKVKKNNKHCGLEADCAIFSFHAVKNLPSSDAGAICFKKKKFDKIARNLSWLGINKTTYERSNLNQYNWKYNVNDLGYKYHGNSLIAAICLVSLKYLDKDNIFRNYLCKIYSSNLKSVSNFVEIINHDPNIVSSRHTFQIAVENRNDLLKYLAKNNIYCGVHYINNANYKLYKKFKADIKKTDYYSSRIISLPLNLHLNEEKITYICKKIKDYYSN